jgi:uncharacterized protein YecE (DUF72 family)
MIYVGTSGWQYRDWRGRFYPAGLPLARWLPYYAERFRTVEVNNTFYRLPKRETFERWADATPPDFVFALKVSRFLTQFKRLRDPQEPAERFMKAASGLAGKLGPLLLQLPPGFRAAPEQLREALAAFPEGVRLAVEFRDDSWWTDAVRQVLERADAALCLADRGGRLVSADWRTAGWGYVRLHWGADDACYSEFELRTWSRLLCDRFDPGDDVFVFFNNDPGACAVRNASEFARLLAEAGRYVSRTPDPLDTLFG